MKIYCKVTEGPLHKTLTKFFDDASKAREKWKAWGIPLGVTHTHGSTCFFVKGKEPTGWRKSSKHEGGFLPDKRTVQGRELAEQMMNLPIIPGAVQLVIWYLSTRKNNIMEINRTGTPAVKHIDSKTYLVAIDDYWLPKDRAGIKEITASEFQKLWDKKKERKVKA